jgi:nucleotide-binding universal stress UspA family protein
MLGLLALVAIGAMSLLGALLFLVYGRKRAGRVGLYGRLGPRRDLVAELHPEGHDLRDALPGEADVVVALLGEERTPEALVEMGGALASGGKIEVLHLTDVPDQTALEGVLEEPAIRSLERRVEALGEERDLDIEFDAAVTHDVARTVHEVTRRVHCKWLVLEWHGEEGSGISLFNPLGWMINHLTANLAFFKDAGIRYFRKILVVPQPGPNDVLVAETADHLAATFGARLTFVRHVAEPASDATRDGALAYLGQLSKLCEGEPELLLVHGADEADAISEITVAYDLVVIGDRPGVNVREKLFGNEVEKITADASCSVIRLKTPRAITRMSLMPPVPGRAEVTTPTPDG